jgi:ABC-2 type transport system ATP-binding protein
MDRTIREYSRGNAQKLAIVIAFMHDPDLVIMDEPTSGLDPLMQERFHDFLRAERQRGTTIFFSSHVLSEVRKICDRIGIIRDGHLVALEAIESLLDRSGKSVHVRVAERVSETDFELEGAHDVTIGSEHDQPPRSVTANSSEMVTDGGDAAIRRGTSVRFTYTGGYNALLSRLLDYTLVDLDIEEAPLEDVFMRFYDTGAEENDDAHSARTVSDDECESSDRGDETESESGDDAGSDDGGR